MLVSLSIRDIVLIDRLDVAFQTGLCVLTGETGAGKSILLDALGLALGNRAETGLLRPAAKQASVAAGFEVDSDHPAAAILAEQGILADDGEIVVRRVVGRDGRSRAFVNDQPVSVGFLRRLGDSLVEVQGQFEQRGLLDVATHRDLLDAYGRLSAGAAQVAELWRDWRKAIEDRDRAAQDLDKARQEEAFLRHAVDELDALDPQPDEEDRLADQRALAMNAERLTEAMGTALTEISGGEGSAGAEAMIAGARRALERIADKAGSRLDPVLQALGSAAAEVADASAELQSLSADMDLDPDRLAQVEERLFALRDLARKHGTSVDRLAALHEDMAVRLSAIEGGEGHLAELEQAVGARRDAYVAAAKAQSDARRRAAETLDRAVAVELAPLKLDKAVFRTRVERADESEWGAHGMDQIAFEVSTNPGSPVGPLAKIASGGELARFLLAIKVALAEVGPARTLVFDEVDAGIGGAAAHAVGERLARLTRDRQVLVVTHSPQVGARGAHHWRVHKEPHGELVATRVSELGPEERREEIARMLSGAEITEEARAAARRLIEAEAG